MLLISFSVFILRCSGPWPSKTTKKKKVSYMRIKSLDTGITGIIKIGTTDVSKSTGTQNVYYLVINYIFRIKRDLSCKVLY